METKIARASIIAITPYFLIFSMQVFFASFLSVEIIGKFALVNFLLLFFMTSTNWGADKYIITNKAITKDGTNEIFTQEIIFAIIVYLICLFVFRENVMNYTGLEDSWLFWVFLALIFLYHPLSRSKALLEKEMSLTRAYMPALISNLLGAILGIFFLQNGFGIWSMVIWKMSIFIFEDIILLVSSPNRPGFKISCENIRPHFRFCLPLFLGALFSFFSVTADIWIVNNMLGQYELGLYWFAFSISHVALAFRAVIIKILLPALSRKKSIEDKIILFSNLNIVLQIFFVAVTIITAYWGRDIFILIFGSKWSMAAPLFVILVYAVAFKVISGTANTLLHSIMKTDIDLNVAIVNTIVLIPIVVIATYFFGVTGTASAILTSTVLMTFYVYQTHVKKVCNLGFWYFFSYLTINLTSLILVTNFFYQYLDNIVGKIIATIASSLFAYMVLKLPSLTGRKISIESVLAQKI